MEFVVLFTVILFIVAMAKIMKTYELSESLKVDSDEVVPESDSKNTAIMMLLFGVVFLGSVFYQMHIWGDLVLPESASEHGVIYDDLMNVSLVLIFIVFFITHVLLFWFCYKYYNRKGKKAYWYPHNNRLEVAWTVVPSIILIMLIMYGLSVWKDIMRNPDKEVYTEIELYAEQFIWTARYPGKDGKLGEASFTLITPTNGLGVITGQSIVDREIAGNASVDRYQTIVDSLLIQDSLGWNVSEALSNAEMKLSAEQANLRRLETIKLRHQNEPFTTGEDDALVKNEFYIPKGKEIRFQMRSKDIIHSAYMPHFRSQINCVPGMKTYFTFKPTITTNEMKEKTGDENFEYYLLCNKICGASHYAMKMVIKVVEEDEYQDWLKTQVYKDDATAESKEGVVVTEVVNLESVSLSEMK